MQRGRKSTIQLQPIRIGMTHHSTLGFGPSPSPLRSELGPRSSTRTRRPLGSSKKKRVSPVKLSDINLEVMSTKVKPNIRRRLYQEEDVGGRLNSTVATSAKYKVPQAKKQVDHFKLPNSSQKSRIPQNTVLQRRTMYAQTHRTAVVCPSLPKSKTSLLPQRGTGKSTLKSQNSSKTACNCPEELLKAIEDIKCVVNDQKLMLQEAKQDISLLIKEQRQQFLDMIKALQEKSSSKSVADSSVLELLSNTQPSNSDDQKPAGGNKENSIRKSARRSRKSLQVYQSLQGMGCLNTPIVSTKKKETPRTLRTSLSRRVQAQLETLFDD